MGQYYKPIFLNKAKTKPVGFAYSHDFANGLKLMEHSWMKNDFVGFIERQLLIEPRPLVWAGDYADNEPVKNIPKEIIKAKIKENYEYYKKSTSYSTEEKKKRLNDAIKEITENGINLYEMAETSPKLTHNQHVKDKYSHDFKLALPKKFKYLINYDKKEFVDKTQVPIDADGWQIHPLPLLTCEGNGRGGGDFRGDEKGLIGRWSRDTIGVSSKKSDIPKDFKQIDFNLTE